MITMIILILIMIIKKLLIIIMNIKKLLTSSLSAVRSSGVGLIAST